MFPSWFRKSKSSNIKNCFSHDFVSLSLQIHLIFTLSSISQYFFCVLEFLINQFSLFLFNGFSFPMFHFLILVYQFHTLIDYFPFGKSLSLSPNFCWFCAPVFQCRQCSSTHWDHERSWCRGSWQGWCHHWQRLWCWSWLRGLCLCTLSTVEKCSESSSLFEPPSDYALLNPSHQQHQ